MLSSACISAYALLVYALTIASGLHHDDESVSTGTCPTHKYVAYMVKEGSDAPDWQAAQGFCQDVLGTELATIHSKEDFDEAMNAAQAAGISAFAWISSGTGATYMAGTGVNHPGNDCAAMKVSSATWNDRDCSACVEGFICNGQPAQPEPELAVNQEVDCMTKTSALSGATNDARTSVTCPSGFTMTGCSAYSESTALDGSYMHAPDFFPRLPAFWSHSNKMQCVAQNGEGGTGVQAVARCCKLDASTSCEVVQSPRSGSENGDTTVASCGTSGAVLTGCSAFSADGNIDGVFPGEGTYQGRENVQSEVLQDLSDNFACQAWNGDGGHGVYALATCCGVDTSRANLECQSIWSEDDGSRAQISCKISDGWFMAGCSAFSPWGEVKGSFVQDQEDNDDLCVAEKVFDAFPERVWAVGMCCKESLAVN